MFILKAVTKACLCALNGDEALSSYSLQITLMDVCNQWHGHCLSVNA